jgi:hypothetical protein
VSIRRSALLCAPILAVSLMLVSGTPAQAALAPIGLGTAGSFAVLAASTVTNTGPSTISGDLGVSPGTAVTGFGPGTVVGGTIHSSDAVALQAQTDLTTAYNTAAGLVPTANVTADLGGQSLVPGVYAGPTLSLTGALTLNAGGDPNAVFVFQAGSTLITASSSSVLLLGGANPCNVFWQVGSSATLGTNSTLSGSVLALTSITANTGASIAGRLLARNAAVTLDSNTVSRLACGTVPAVVIPTPGAVSSPAPVTATPGAATPIPTPATAPRTPAGAGSSTTPGATTGSAVPSPADAPTSTPRTAIDAVATTVTGPGGVAVAQPTTPLSEGETAKAGPVTPKRLSVFRGSGTPPTATTTRLPTTGAPIAHVGGLALLLLMAGVMSLILGSRGGRTA